MTKWTPQKAEMDQERLVAPQNLADFLRDSPLAEAVAADGFGDPSGHDPFARPRDMGRSLDLA